MSRTSTPTWTRSPTWVTWKQNSTRSAPSTTRSGCTRASATSRPTTSTTAGARPSATPASRACKPEPRQELPSAASYGKIRHDTPLSGWVFQPPLGSFGQTQAAHGQQHRHFVTVGHDTLGQLGQQRPVEQLCLAVFDQRAGECHLDL